MNKTYPVFPLPEFVIFPFVKAPLHIFEPRYRGMIDQVLDRDGKFCIATLCHKQRIEGGEEFHATGCLCKLVDYRHFNDGRYNIIIEGLESVTMTEVQSPELYRQVSIQSRKIDTCEFTDEMILELNKFVKKLGDTNQDLVDYVSGLSYEAKFMNLIYYSPINSQHKQELLEMTDLSIAYRKLIALSSEFLN
ncbi:MAG: LON peptidase substrate-binding domain-containing protein [Lentisphaeria bacterium]|nr:LON peptidase substrate-binding domain-containing protein [Lentisphaeria bacterium]NQZ67629.1 LON peptidase substrate-binding domain-containing protein [Lentisphaeria bacterium]